MKLYGIDSKGDIIRASERVGRVVKTTEWERKRGHNKCEG